MLYSFRESWKRVFLLTAFHKLHSYSCLVLFLSVSNSDIQATANLIESQMYSRPVSLDPPPFRST